MPVEVGGAGTLGLAFETTLGTYVVPTKWIPIRSESLMLIEDKVYRMNLRGKADRTGAIQGYQRVEGDIVFEVSADALLYFMYAMRVTPVKTGAGPFTYTFTPAHVAKTSTAAGPTTRKTLSILTQRSAQPFGYLGCSVSQLALTVDAGVLVATASVVGVGAAVQSAGTPSFPAQTILGPGKVTLEIPDATPRADSDTFNLTINDNAIAANRLNGLRSAAYVNWGERELSASMEYDFESLTDYNDFITQVFRTFEVVGNGGASNSVNVLLNAAVNEAHAVNLSGLGDVVRGSVNYHGIFDTTDAYTATLLTAESIV